MAFDETASKKCISRLIKLAGLKGEANECANKLNDFISVLTEPAVIEPNPDFNDTKAESATNKSTIETKAAVYSVPSRDGKPLTDTQLVEKSTYWITKGKALLTKARAI